MDRREEQEELDRISVPIPPPVINPFIPLGPRLSAEPLEHPVSIGLLALGGVALIYYVFTLKPSR